MSNYTTYNMSHKVNTEWLEAAKEHLDGAIDEGNYSLCKAILADIRDNGFSVEAAQLEETFREVPLTKFVIKSPYA